MEAVRRILNTWRPDSSTTPPIESYMSELPNLYTSCGCYIHLLCQAFRMTDPPSIEFCQSFTNVLRALIEQHGSYSMLVPFFGVPYDEMQIHNLFPHLPILPKKIFGIDIRATEYNQFTKYEDFPTSMYKSIEIHDNYTDFSYPQGSQLTLHNAEVLNFLVNNPRRLLVGASTGVLAVLSGVHVDESKKFSRRTKAYLQHLGQVLTNYLEPGDMMVLNDPLYVYNGLFRAHDFVKAAETTHSCLLVRTAQGCE